MSKDLMRLTDGDRIHLTELSDYSLDGFRLSWDPDNFAIARAIEPPFIANAVRCCKWATCQAAESCCGAKPHSHASGSQRCYDHKPYIQGGVLVWDDPVMQHSFLAPQWKCLSIRQPWAWLIAHGWKNIENRTWRTHFRGRFLIHASQGMTRDEYEACRIFIAGFTEIELPPMDKLERGGIVGEATLLECMNYHESEWFTGPWGFVLDDARPLPFVQLKGERNFFKYVEPMKGAA